MAVNNIYCPECGAMGSSEQYPGETLYCWECARNGKGRVRVEVTSTPEQREKKEKEEKSA